MSRRQPWDVCEQYGCGDRQSGSDPEHARIEADFERAHRESRGVASDSRKEGLSQQDAQHDDREHGGHPFEQLALHHAQ